MGAAISYTNVTNEMLTDITSTFVINNSKNCNISNTNTQIITLPALNITNCDDVTITGISNDIEVSINNECLQNQDDDVALKTQFDQIVKQKIESATSGLVLGISNTTVIGKTDIANIISETVDVRNLANCLVENTNLQEIKGGPINVTCRDGGKFEFSDVSQSIIENASSKCVQDALSKVSSDKQIKLENHNITESKIAGLSFLDFLMAIIFPFIIICIVIGLSIFLVKKAKGAVLGKSSFGYRKFKRF